MQVPVYGNNAYKYEGEAFTSPKKKVVRKVRMKKQKASTAVRSAAMLGLIVVLCFGFLLGNAQILEKRARVAALEKELDTVHAKIVAGQFEIERNMDLYKVEEEATMRLGMQRPTKAQTVYVNMRNCDYAECSQAAEPKKENVFSAFANSVREYFG